MKNIYERAESLLGVDARSLGLFRIAIGVVLLYDLIIRSFSLTAHYTDQGIVSRHALKGLSDNPLLLSLNMLSGDPLWQWLLFFLAACFAVCLIIGYRSQWACFGCLVLMLSIHVRNPFVNNLGDWFLLHLLFWGCLLPLGVRFSVDTRRQRTLRQLPRQILSIATLGILVQIAALYFFSVFKKNSPVWHTDGTAVHYALRLDRFVTHIGEWVLSLPYDWLTAVTSATLFLEQWGPILLFVPFFIAPIRIALVSSFVLFHTGLALTLELGIFPFVCISAWLLVLPSVFWDRIISFRNWKPWRHRLIPAKRAAEDVSLSFVINTLLATCMLLIMISGNLLYIEKMSVAYYEGLYKYVEPLTNSLNMQQRWSMFSPHPSRQDGWVVLAGVKEDGTMIDVWRNGEPVTWERPEDISALHRNQRWRKNLEYVTTKWDRHARLLGTYSLREWNESQEEKVTKVLVYFMSELEVGPEESSPVSKKLLYTAR